MLPGYTLIRAYFYDQNRTIINCELQDLETDEITQYSVPNDPENSEYQKLLEDYSIDDIHEQTFKYIRRSQTELKRVAIEVAKRNGWLLSEVAVEDDIAEQDEYRNQLPSDEWIRQKEREFEDREKQLEALQQSVYADREDVKARRARLEEKQKQNEKDRAEIAARKQALTASVQENKQWRESLQFKERELTSKEQDVSAQEFIAPNIEDVLLTYVFNTNVNPEYIFNLKLKLFDMDFIKECKDRSLKKDLRVAKTVDEVIKAAINLFQYKEQSAES